MEHVAAQGMAEGMLYGCMIERLVEAAQQSESPTPPEEVRAPIASAGLPTMTS